MKLVRWVRRQARISMLVREHLEMSPREYWGLVSLAFGVALMIGSGGVYALYLIIKLFI